MVRASAVIAVVVAALGAPSAAKAVVGGASTPGHLAPGAVWLDLPADECSGSLIAPRVVMTANHCLPPRAAGDTSGLGRRATVTVGNPNGGARTRVRRVVAVHGAPQRVDVALLVLDRPVSERPLLVARAAEVDALTVPGAALAVVGFGRGAVAPEPPPGTALRHGALTAVTCPAFGAGDSYAGCARPAAKTIADSPPANSCFGDSGAPVLAPSPIRAAAPVQVGVVSGALVADVCATGTTLFTRITPAVALWIQTAGAGPYPPPAARPRFCAQLLRDLPRARRHGPRRSVTAIAARLYRHC